MWRDSCRKRLQLNCHQLLLLCCCCVAAACDSLLLWKDSYCCCWGCWCALLLAAAGHNKTAAFTTIDSCYANTLADDFRSICLHYLYATVQRRQLLLLLLLAATRVLGFKRPRVQVWRRTGNPTKLSRVQVLYFGQGTPKLLANS
jgi:hypothetical protein